MRYDSSFPKRLLSSLNNIENKVSISRQFSSGASTFPLALTCLNTARIICSMLVESHILDRLTANATAEKHIYYGVSWDAYLQLLEDLGDDSKVRLTFNHGVLEIMSPKRLHEQI